METTKTQSRTTEKTTLPQTHPRKKTKRVTQLQISSTPMSLFLINSFNKHKKTQKKTLNLLLKFHFRPPPPPKKKNHREFHPTSLQLLSFQSSAGPPRRRASSAPSRCCAPGASKALFFWGRFHRLNPDSNRGFPGFPEGL